MRSVKGCIATLLDVPKITISVVPLTSSAHSSSVFNIMNLPLISTYISNAIRTALAEYVAPKSLTLDLQQIISGDDVKKDIDAIGVLVVTIHNAKDLQKMDLRGESGSFERILIAYCET